MTEAMEKHRNLESRSRTEWVHLREQIRSPTFVLTIALIVRILTVLILYSAKPSGAADGIWKSGPEVVNIAASLSNHKGFSSPFAVESGPTAWIPPIYPSFLAGIFWVAGERSHAGALAILCIQALFSALICIPLYAIAKRSFDERCALWAVWGWALFPYAVILPVLFVWETSLSAFLAVLLCWQSTSGWWKDRSSSIWLGVVWGVAALTNTALLGLMPVFLLAACLERRVVLRKRVATVVLVCVLVVCPWIARNWLVLRAIVPVRSNFGEELWLGNHEGSTGRIEFGLNPSDNTFERERYVRLGEITYVKQRRGDAMQFIRKDPARFGRLLLFRVAYWWWAQGENARIFVFYRLLTLLSAAGIALALLKARHSPLLVPLGAILIYPVVYYLTDVYARYRYPIEPFLMVFAGFGLSRAIAFVRPAAEPNR